MRTIYVPLPEEAADRLRELARREMRDPRSQASWLILEGLRRAASEPDPPPDAAALRRREPVR